MTSTEIIEYFESLRNDKQREILMRFFKTGKGQYGYGDEFLGIKVPQVRSIVKHCTELPLSQVPDLLHSRWHEVRLCGFLILVARFEKLCTKRLTNDAQAIAQRDNIIAIYLANATYANNWDLVDLSVIKTLGQWMLMPSQTTYEGKTAILDRLAASTCLWEQRMSMVCTWRPTRSGMPELALHYAQVHMQHKHDLMHKAMGWMLREVGKHCSMDTLRSFLSEHARHMPRTALRYAIEKMNDDERHYWMSL